MKPHYLFIFLLTFLLASCDTYEEAGINNDTDNDIQFITIGSPAQILTENAVLDQQIGERYHYTLRSRTYDAFLQLINQEVEPDNMPFDTLIIINQLDTLSLNSRQAIFDALDLPLRNSNVYQILLE